MLAGSPCRFRGGHGGPFLSVSLDHRVHVRAPQALGYSQHGAAAGAQARLWQQPPTGGSTTGETLCRSPSVAPRPLCENKTGRERPRRGLVGTADTR